MLMLCRDSPVESEAASQKHPLIVDLKTPGKQSATKAWFSKVDIAIVVILSIFCKLLLLFSQ